MTILTSANGSLPLTLRKGETLVIRNYSGAETVTGSTAAKRFAVSTYGEGAVCYGPQVADATLTISSTGSIDYSVVSGVASPVRDLPFSTEGVATARAANKLDRQKAALTQATVWASGATVQPYDIRRLSTGVMLVAVQAAAGTTGASEPTVTAGTAPAAITDNTVTWWPFQAVSRPAPAGVPVVTVTDNAGASARTLTNIYLNPAKFEQASAPNIYLQSGSGTTTQSRAWSVNDGGTANFGPGAGRVCKYRTISFLTNEDVIDVGYFTGIATFENTRLVLEVDGYPATEAPVIPGAVGSSRHFKFTIPGGRRERLIRIRCHGGFSLQYIGTAADTTIRKPPVRALTLVACTDSYGDTEMPSVNEANFDLAPSMSRRLGFPNCVFVGSGGTSYSSDDGSGSGRKALKTIMQTNDFSQFQADAWVYMHGYNAAVNGTSTATESDAALFCWTTAQALTPTAPQIIVGPHYQRPTYEAAVLAMSAALKANFLAWGNPNSAYIDPQDGSITLGDGTIVRAGDSAWVNTTNASWAIPPSGGVFDGVHLSIAGKAYYEDCIASAAEEALTALGY